MEIDIEAERLEILKRYRSLLRAAKRIETRSDKILIRKAFELAVDAHKEMRRKSGEPYIYHPIAVAHIVAEEIGLGTTSIACALLHDVVEDTDITLENIRTRFNEKIAKIIDGLTKISSIYDPTSSLQAENFRKMLLTMSDDVRVILIKLADRLHNMRTLESMPRQKQLKIASETLYIYAPLAHRLGLHAIKTELEDLGLKYTEPEVYESITQKLKDTQRERTRYINKFIEPIKLALEKEGIQFNILGRLKSIFSIWNKMKKKGVPFEEVFDLFAIRIIIDSEAEYEKSDCWKVYSIVSDYYLPNPDRLRDWISTPKANGYESLHTTVMGPKGLWVEVQIRSKRMDAIAEKGYAAHYIYKGAGDENALEEWLNRLRDVLQNMDDNAIDFIDDFKLNLFAEEIFVFTPSGELKKMPVHSTALDFAFEIHTQIGQKCIGAKVNNKLVPLSHQLVSGDQVEILTSNKQTPKEEWLNYVITAKAKSLIKNKLKEEKKKIAAQGKELFKEFSKAQGIKFNTANMNELLAYYKSPSLLDLFYRIAINKIDLGPVKKFVVDKGNIDHNSVPTPDKTTFEQLVTNVRGKSDLLIIGDTLEKIDYSLATCCSPIPGDDVFGFITQNEGIHIHRTNCKKAIELMSNYAYRVVRAKWTSQELIAFLAGIELTGIDAVGIVNNITKIISNEHNINIRSISFESNDGIFEGKVMLYVHDNNNLTELIKKIKKVNGVLTVNRIGS